MIPIRPIDAESACRPEWVRLNPLLSYCARPLVPPSGIDGESKPAARCNHQDCLFSATRL